MTDPDALTLADFQRHIERRYGDADRARGSARTFLWLIEEVGELATALNGDAADPAVRANLEEEFADVLAWLCTMANINGVDLPAAVARKYFGDKPPEGVK